MQEKIKHLEMIERIIERMAANSFHLKGWSMTLVTIVGALSAKESDHRFLILAFAPIVVFWFLDTYYLRLERRYKALYREVLENETVDFNLNTDNVSYTKVESHNTNFFWCLFSFSEVAFYGILAGTLCFLMCKLKVFEVL